MYKINGIKAGRDVSVTWDQGDIDNEDAKAFVIRRLIDLAPGLEDGMWVAPGLQACPATLGDSVFTHIVLCEWFDEVTSVEGDTGLEPSVPGFIY